MPFWLTNWLRLKTQAATAQKQRLELALAGSDTAACEETSWKAAARVSTLNDALRALDAEIAEAEAAAIRAKLEADRRKAAAHLESIVTRAEAEFTARTWLVETSPR